MNNGLTIANQAGISLGQSLLGISVSDNRCGDNQGVKTQAFGLSFNGCTDCTIHDNDLRGNLTTALNGTGTLTTSSIRNCNGVNPVGTNVVATQGGTSTPVSTTVYTNAGPYDVLAGVYNGTSSVIYRIVLPTGKSHSLGSRRSKHDAISPANKERSRTEVVVISERDIPPGSLLSDQTLADIRAGNLGVKRWISAPVPKRFARPSAERRYWRRHEGESPSGA
jgi:hypothetical protein